MNDQKNRNTLRRFAIFVVIAFAFLHGSAGLAQAPSGPPSSIAESPAFGGGGGALATPSSYRLIGTIEGKSFIGAVLDDPTGMQTFYRLGEKLPDGSQIVKVESDSISLKSPDGAPYELYINHDMVKTSGPSGPAASFGQPVSAPAAAPAARPAFQAGGGQWKAAPADFAAMREARMKERGQMREQAGGHGNDAIGPGAEDQGGGRQRHGRPGMDQ